MELEYAASALGFSLLRRSRNNSLTEGDTAPADHRSSFRAEETTKQISEDYSPRAATFMGGSRTDSGAVGYAVSWKRGLQWKGHRVDTGFQQEAYDAKCAIISRALEAAALRPLAHEHTTIYTEEAVAGEGGEELGKGPLEGGWPGGAWFFFFCLFITRMRPIRSW